MMKTFSLLCLLILPVAHAATDSQKTLDLKAEPIPLEIIAYGVIQREAWELSFEVSGDIEELLVNSGEHVKKGQVLARLDSDLLQNQEQRLQTQLAYSKKKLDKARRLVAKASLAEDTLDDREHEVNMQKLELAQVQINLAKHELTAPADGVILSRQLEHPGMIQAGQSVFIFKSADTPWRVSVQLSPAEVLNIKPGGSASITLASGETLGGAVELIKHRANPGDNSQEVLITLESSPRPLSAGAKVSVRIVPSKAKIGYWVPISALSQIHDNTGKLRLLKPADTSIETRRVHLSLLRHGYFAVFEDLSGYQKLMIVAD